MRDASTKRCVVTVDGEKPPAVELASTHTNESPVDILWGVTYANVTTAYDGLYFDDFVVTAGP